MSVDEMRREHQALVPDKKQQVKVNCHLAAHLSGLHEEHEVFDFAQRCQPMSTKLAAETCMTAAFILEHGSVLKLLCFSSLSFLSLRL